MINLFNIHLCIVKFGKVVGNFIGFLRNACHSFHLILLHILKKYLILKSIAIVNFAK